MTKEELLSQGWEFSFSGSCPVEAWGKYTVHLKHVVNGRMVHGYGEDEAVALNNAVETIQKPPEVKHEVSH